MGQLEYLQIDLTFSLTILNTTIILEEFQITVGKGYGLPLNQSHMLKKLR